MSELRFLDALIQKMRFRAASPEVPTNARVLDVGTADGSWLSYLAPRIKPSVGVDPDATDGSTQEGHLLVKGTLESLPPSDPFDCVTALAVLEHLSEEDLSKFGQLLLSRTTPDATLVVTVPSPAVDRILDVGIRLRLLDGMEAEAHHGLDVSEVPRILGESGWTLRKCRKFEFRLNNLFTFSRADTRGSVTAGGGRSDERST